MGVKINELVIGQRVYISGRREPDKVSAIMCNIPIYKIQVYGYSVCYYEEDISLEPPSPKTYIHEYWLGLKNGNKNYAKTKTKATWDEIVKENFTALEVEHIKTEEV